MTDLLQQIQELLSEATDDGGNGYTTVELVEKLGVSKEKVLNMLRNLSMQGRLEVRQIRRMTPLSTYPMRNQVYFLKEPDEQEKD